MNSRTLLALVALCALALVAVLAASALADPADINNPPTEDWVFNSGNPVTITGKTWDISYNVSVMGKSALTFDRCTFDVSDQYDLNTLWMNVWWNGSMVLKNCKFSSSGIRGYFIIADGNISLDGTTLTGMVQAGYRPGAMSAKGCSVAGKYALILDPAQKTIAAKFDNFMKQVYRYETGEGEQLDCFNIIWRTK